MTSRLIARLTPLDYRRLTAFCARTGLNRAQVARTLVFNFLYADYREDAGAFVRFAQQWAHKIDGGRVVNLPVEMNAAQYGLLSQYCRGLTIGTGTVASMLVATLIRNLRPGIAEDAFRLQASRLSAHSPSSPQWGSGEQLERKRPELYFIARTFVEQHPRMSGIQLSVALRGLGVRHSRKRVLYWRKIQAMRPR